MNQIPLAQALKAVRDREFVAGHFLNENDLRDRLIFAQIRELLKAQNRLKSNALEEPELLFDRLLLNKSRHYRRTRELGKKMGLRFSPQLLSLDRSLESFTEDPDTIPFSPIQSELKWLLFSGIWSEEVMARLRDLKAFGGVTYHEINHWILFRLLRPSARTLKSENAIDHYYGFVESLVIFQDIQLAFELDAVGAPLMTFGMLYRDLPVLEASAIDESFLQLSVLYTFFRLMQVSHAKTLGLLKKTGIGVAIGRILRTNDLFFTDTHMRWLKKYKLKTQGRLLLPPRCDVRGVPSLEFDLMPPEELLKNPDELKRIFSWFRRIFPVSLSGTGGKK